MVADLFLCQITSTCLKCYISIHSGYITIKDHQWLVNSSSGVSALTCMVMTGCRSSYSILTALAALWAWSWVLATTAPMIWPTQVTCTQDRQDINLNPTKPDDWLEENKPRRQQGQSHQIWEIRRCYCQGCHQQTGSRRHQGNAQHLTCL